VNNRKTSPQQSAHSSALPGPVADRASVEGWKQWWLTRHDFVPAPRLSVADYRAMSPRRRQIHDLHRDAAHANLPLQAQSCRAQQQDQCIGTAVAPQSEGRPRVVDEPLLQFCDLPPVGELVVVEDLLDPSAD
jgi:hypothetical protein